MLFTKPSESHKFRQKRLSTNGQSNPTPTWLNKSKNICDSIPRENGIVNVLERNVDSTT